MSQSYCSPRKLAHTEAQIGVAGAGEEAGELTALVEGDAAAKGLVGKEEEELEKLVGGEPHLTGHGRQRTAGTGKKTAGG